MNYQKIYDSLILKAKLRNTVLVNGESHHIIPRSLNGSDAGDNLVNLTISEHFLAHALLAQIHKHTDPNQIFALKAFFELKGSKARDIWRKTHRLARWQRQRMSIQENLLRQKLRKDYLSWIKLK